MTEQVSWRNIGSRRRGSRQPFFDSYLLKIQLQNGRGSAVIGIRVGLIEGGNRTAIGYKAAAY